MESRSWRIDMPYERIFFRIHAIERMLEHDITEVEVRDVLENGEIIEDAIDRFGMSKKLYLRFAERPLHVVIVVDDEAERIEVITAYEPDLDRWEPGFRTRKRL